MEEASGKDLKWFFDQWLYKAGHPELKVRWHYEDADKTVRVKVEQTQKVDEQTPLFRLPTTLDLTEAAGKSRVIPIVIDGASQEFVIPAAVKPVMVRIDPDCWLVKELDFEKSIEERLFELEHASCVVCRLNTTRSLVRQGKDEPRVQKALETAWKHEKSVSARTSMVELIAGVESSRRRRRPGAGQARPVGEEPDDTFRSTLAEAAKDPEARVRVAAIRGLARLKRDAQSESILRAAWSNPKEAYGARTAAIRALAGWKVKDADELLSSALKSSAGKHRLAASALEILLEEPGPRARELAALYARYGQPRELCTAAIGAFDRLAKDDPLLHDMVIPLVDDPDRSVGFRAWSLASSLKIQKALPALEARSKKEGGGPTGFVFFGCAPGRQILEHAVNTLKETPSKATTASSWSRAPAPAQTPGPTPAPAPTVEPPGSLIWRNKPKTLKTGPGSCENGSRL